MKIYKNLLGDNSKIKYDTIAGDGNVMNDFVIDYRWDGGSGGAKFLKFNSGIMIQWGHVTKNINYDTAWGTLYYGQFGTIVYPHAFKYTPYFLPFAGDSNTFFTGKNNSGASATQSVRVDVYRPTTASHSAELSWIAIGQWK